MVEGVREVKSSSSLNIVDFAAWLEGFWVIGLDEPEQHFSPFSAWLKSGVRASKIMNSFLPSGSTETVLGKARSCAAEFLNGRCLCKGDLHREIWESPVPFPASLERTRRMTARGVIASVLADQSDARRGLQAKENSRDNAVNSLQNRWRKPLSFPISK